MRWVHSFHRYASLHTRFLLVNVYDRLITVWMEYGRRERTIGWDFGACITSLTHWTQSSAPLPPTCQPYLAIFPVFVGQ